MYQTELDLMIAICRNARPLAMEYFAKAQTLAVEQKADLDPNQDSPVTAADYALDKYLKENLMAARPNYGWLSEETTDNTDRLSKSHVWVVDPIDGTRGFIEGSDTWTISVALVVDHVAVAGVVYSPVRDELMAGEHNGTLIHEGIKQNYPPQTLLVSHSETKDGLWSGLNIEGWEPAYSNSAAYKFAQIGVGMAAATLCFRQKSEWDIAAAAAICSASDVILTDVKGQPLQFNQPDVKTSCGLLAGTPAAHRDLLTKIHF